jgi:tRNA threonylcarbamoyladenosine biosynthesis protein TsaE
MEPYTLTKPQGVAWHFDFYRFNDPQEWEDAGFRDLFASEGLKLVEWPDQAAGLLPEPDLALSIEPGEIGETRRVQWQARSMLGVELLP